MLLDHLGGVAEGLSYVVVLQLGEGFEDLGAGHAVGDHADDGGHGDPHTPDAGDAPICAGSTVMRSNVIRTGLPVWSAAAAGEAGND